MRETLPASRRQRDNRSTSPRVLKPECTGTRPDSHTPTRIRLLKVLALSLKLD